MPIYEYYCNQCNGKFRYLARQVDAPAPPCPRCGNPEATRTVSAAAMLHTQSHHEAQLGETRQHIDKDDHQAVARFLQESGRLSDAEGLYGSKAYRELLVRRAEGASEADVADLVPDLVSEMQGSEVTQMAGAVMFSDRVENRMGAEGPPEDHEHEHQGTPQSKETSPIRRRADDLGWV